MCGCASLGEICIFCFQMLPVLVAFLFCILSECGFCQTACGVACTLADVFADFVELSAILRLYPQLSRMFSCLYPRGFL